MEGKGEERRGTKICLFGKKKYKGKNVSIWLIPLSTQIEKQMCILPIKKSHSPSCLLCKK